MAKEQITVAPCDWHGRDGWQAEGWAGETKEEAVLEMCLQEADSEGAAWDRYANIEIIVGE